MIPVWLTWTLEIGGIVYFCILFFTILKWAIQSWVEETICKSRFFTQLYELKQRVWELEKRTQDENKK